MPISTLLNRPRRVLLIALLPLTGGLCSALEANTFEERRDWMWSSLREQTLPTGGGVARAHLGVAAARLRANPSDSAAIAYTASVRSAGHAAFNMPMLARVYLTFRDAAPGNFSAADRAGILANALAVENWNEDYTENHRLLLWSALHLLAQAFPGADGWRWEEAGELRLLSSAEARETTKAALQAYGRSLFQLGHNEFLSPQYESFKLAAWLNLRDLAEDAEVRASAEAALTYHAVLLAHALDREILLPPYSRGTGNPLRQVISADIQWLLWLFWGVAQPGIGQDAPGSLLHFFFALSDWRAPAALEPIVHREFAQPYSFFAQQPFFFSRAPRHMVRTTYQHPRYAVSSGIHQLRPDELNMPGARQLLDDGQFMISWESAREPRQMTVASPYWRATGANLWNHLTSPFMQIGQHEGTALVLFEIPAEDPWSHVVPWQENRLPAPLPRAEVRIPAHLTAETGGLADDWLFFADGETYIALKVLKPGHTTNRRALEHLGFNVLNSVGTTGQPWQTGFIFEVRSADAFTDLAAFMADVRSRPLTVDWTEGTVAFENTKGRALTMAFNRDFDGPSVGIPAVAVGGRFIDFSAWPVLQSPFAEIREGRMRVADGPDDLVIDWQGGVPQFDRARALPGPGSLFDGAVELAPGWFFHPRFGFAYLENHDGRTGRGWIYLPSTGWFFAHYANGHEFLRLADSPNGWLYAQASFFPHVFDFSDFLWKTLYLADQ